MMEGEPMRAIDCKCGEQLLGSDDEELFREYRNHATLVHDEDQPADQQIRGMIAVRAYDVEPPKR
jgi:hypothetical protein